MVQLLWKYFVLYEVRQGKCTVALDLCNLCSNGLREQVNVNCSAIQSLSSTSDVGGLFKIEVEERGMENS